MLDICDLIRFFSKCFKKVNPVTTVNNGTTATAGESHETEKTMQSGSTKNIFSLMVETLS